MYAGLSPDLQSMEQIRRIMRPTDVPDQGLLCDLLWSDPDKDVMGWGENDRGVSFTFGSEVVAKFLHKHDLDLICRAHQVITITSVIRNRTVWSGWVLIVYWTHWTCRYSDTRTAGHDIYYVKNWHTYSAHKTILVTPHMLFTTYCIINMLYRVLAQLFHLDAFSSIFILGSVVFITDKLVV